MGIKVLLADDHDIVRAGIRSVVERVLGMEVVAEAQDGRSAVRLALELSPDIVFMDLTMPDLNGFEATRQIKASSPQVAVVALSMHSDLQFVVGVVKAGASGYLLKNSASRELPEAVRAVLGGKTYFSSQVASLVLDEYLRQSQGGDSHPAVNILTPREREVLQLLAEGKISKEIGTVLGVS